MDYCIIFGGSGFVGTHLAKYFLEQKIFQRVHVADIRKSPLEGEKGVTTSKTDVRLPIEYGEFKDAPDWIFNFAAIHREPGHVAHEYFETNLLGAENVCAYAEAIGCKNIFFTSSISVYGPCFEPTTESKLPNPTTPYGGSKFPSELIHKAWLNKDFKRRLIITRPGVIYGPGDPGNILRMVSAIKGGYFVFPGSKKIKKSYAYIYGFIESILFTMKRSEPLLIYNYVEYPTESIDAMAGIIKRILNSDSPVISLPSFLLMPLAVVMQKVKRNNTAIHPVRVRKAGTPTHIIPQRLQELGFEFKYDFEKSLTHWIKISPKDFE